MKRTDLLSIGFLIAAVIVIFFPVFHADYLYSDEAGQLWYFKKDLNFNTSVPQGRYITYKIFTWLFSSIHTVREVIHARLFSLVGWIVCLPAWYFIIMRVIVKNGLPKTLGVCSLIYLVSMPPFGISIGWASCMQLFIAYTGGLFSGYILYQGITYDDKKMHVSAASIILSALFGMISLFTYQNGFGCFFIPFFIELIAAKKIRKSTYSAAGISLLIYIAYYLLFKYSVGINHLQFSNRSSLAEDPANKLLFFFSRPMAAAFHFTWLVNEQSTTGLIVYILLAAAWLATLFIRQKEKPLRETFSYLAALLVFLLLIYCPSLIVKENYSSNRTLLALDLAVFILVAETIFSFIEQKRVRNTLAGSLCFLFLVNAWYNLNKQFLDPLAVEFAGIKHSLEHNYGSGIKTIFVIRPREDAFKKEYGIVQSWDEFGIPSTAKSWTPEPLIRQLIFEETGDRQVAENIEIKSWPDNEAFRQSGEAVSDSALLLDVEKIGINP
jgi:hypothetical protein